MSSNGGPDLPVRTDTSLSEQRILSPVRLPVPPRGLAKPLLADVRLGKRPRPGMAFRSRIVAMRGLTLSLSPPQMVRSDMAEDDAKPKGPDLTKGVAPTSLGTTACCSARSARMRCCWSGAARTSLPSPPNAATIMARLPTGWWWTARYAAPGIMPVSICAAARPCALPLSIRWIAGRSSSGTARFSSGEKLPRRKPKPRGPARRPKKSSSWAAARPVLPRPRCCAVHGYQGDIIMLSDDAAAPVDRPNLSKDYLAGSAPEDGCRCARTISMPRTASICGWHAEVAAIDPREHEVVLADGGTIAYDRLLLATGAEPVRLPHSRRRPPHVLTLRSLADCRAIIAARRNGARARDRDRRQLHRAGSRGVAAHPRARGPCGRAGGAPAGARDGPGARRRHPRAA